MTDESKPPFQALRLVATLHAGGAVAVAVVVLFAGSAYGLKNYNEVAPVVGIGVVVFSAIVAVLTWAWLAAIGELICLLISIEESARTIAWTSMRAASARRSHARTAGLSSTDGAEQGDGSSDGDAAT